MSAAYAAHLSMFPLGFPLFLQYTRGSNVLPVTLLSRSITLHLFLSCAVTLSLALDVHSTLAALCRFVAPSLYLS